MATTTVFTTLQIFWITSSWQACYLLKLSCNLSLNANMLETNFSTKVHVLPLFFFLPYIKEALKTFPKEKILRTSDCFWDCPEQELANIFWNIFRLCKLYDLCGDASILPLQQWSRHKHTGVAGIQWNLLYKIGIQAVGFSCWPLVQSNSYYPGVHGPVEVPQGHEIKWKILQVCFLYG